MKNKEFDIAKARRETPGCEKIIHFNNAGASLMPECVIDSVIKHLKFEVEMGGYEAADFARDKIEHVYTAAASLLNCHKDEIALIENATRAWDMAFHSIRFKPGDRILTSTSEYASNYISYLQMAKRSGAIIEVIPNDEYGQVSISALQNMLDKRVKLIAVTHVPTNGGLVNPATEIGKIAKEADIFYLLDACQSVGQMPTDVQEIGCDVLTTTSRKYLRGPRGMGLLFVRKEKIEELEPPFLDLHAATWTKKDKYRIRENARRFENWETNVAAKIGIGVAIDYAQSWDLKSIWQRISKLANLFRSQLKTIPKVKLQDLGKIQCGIVSFTVDGIDSEKIQKKLREKKINVSVSHISSTLLDMEARKLLNLVRASIHYYNTEEEIKRFIKELFSIVK